MKKRLKNFFVILLLVSISTLPLNAKAVTLQEYENEVAKYQAQINEKKAQLAKNNETIASVQAKQELHIIKIKDVNQVTELVLIVTDQNQLLHQEEVHQEET